MCFRGGGNRLESSLQRGAKVGRHCYADSETKLLRHYGTKVVLRIKDVKAIRREDDKSETEIVAISRHSEVRQNRKNPVDYNSKQLQNNQNSFTETDHASKPLGIFASKSVSCRISKSDLRLATKKVAFTLAEILVTLGIIGVVAAFTLPILIKNYQMKSFEVAFKKQYSVLNNAINYIQLNNNLSECYVSVITVNYQGRPTDMYSGRNSDCVALKNELISNLKLTPINRYSGFTSISKVRADGGVMINGSVDYDTALKWSSNFYLLPDGAVVMFPNSDSSYFHNNLIFIDVNGAKGPNRWGYDVFCLTLVSKNGILRLSDEYASISEKGGKLPRTILLNEKENNTNFKTYGKW